MKKHYFFSWYFYLFFCALLACSEEVIEPPNALFGADFFPLLKGHSVEYEVTHINYKEFEPTDSIFYYLKEEIGDTLSDFASPFGTSQKVMRYTRTDTLQDWQLDSVWSIRHDFNRIIKVENNIPFVKLILPLDVNSNWNGNVLNALQPQQYNIENFLENTNDYGRSFKVVHRQDSSIVDKNISWEVYAEGIGMVEVLKVELEYISDISNPFYGTDSIRRGNYIHKKAINFIK